MKEFWNVAKGIRNMMPEFDEKLREMDAAYMQIVTDMINDGENPHDYLFDLIPTLDDQYKLVARLKNARHDS